MANNGPFLSFWQSGYEGADHVNHGGMPLDMNSANGHQQRALEDYRLLKQFGIRTVRESIGWRLVEKDGQFDFSIIEARVHAAKELGIQICWSLLHYGWPQDLDVYGDQFVPRFARYCRAAAAFLKPFGGPAPVFSPVNEISFTSWGMSVGMFRHSNMAYEHARRDAKRQLVKAAIAGCDAIWDVIPGARMLHCDPLVHIIAHDDDPATHAHAQAMQESQFEAFDMLAGRRDPELGGAPRYLDLMGVNYYDTNQWEAATGHRLWWHLDDARRRPLHQMLVEVHARYGRPLLLAETGHVGSGRGIWVREVAEQAMMARRRGADIAGICLYPGIDRPDWENPDYWHNSGIWDLVAHPHDRQARVLAPAYAQGLRQAQALTEHLSDQKAIPTIVVFSHIRWHGVHTRPRQVLGNIARHYNIIYVEEPVAGAAIDYTETSHPAPNVTVCRHHATRPVQAADAGPWSLALPFVLGLAENNEAPIVWLSTPMALPLLESMDPSLVIYDCMGVSSLDGEAALLAAADLVFTASPGLRDANARKHQQVHYFPSSVDTVHFEPALDRSNGHPLQAAIGRPRLGFYGTIDEHIDGGLIAAVADAHPEWHIVLVGPIVNVAEAGLPQRANIHYLGPQTYQAWPQFLAGWDVCLMPYLAGPSQPPANAANVLEYMAGERPVVSTAIRDMQALYGDVVVVARDQQEFIAACEAAIGSSQAERHALAQKMREIVRRTSWIAMTDDMHALIALTRKRLSVTGMAA
jgi:UDP-galactopyranose mutase